MVFHIARINEKKIYIYHEKKKKFGAVGWRSYCNTKKMMYCGAGQAGRGLARVPAHDTARGALRHGAGPCDTAGWAATIRRWARGRLSVRAC